MKSLTWTHPVDRPAAPRRRPAAAFNHLFGHPFGHLLGLCLGLALVAATGCTPIGEGPAPPDLVSVVDMTSPSTDQAVASTKCTPTSCKGCCQGDVCQPGITAAACGTAGAVCSQCSESQLCSPSFACAFDGNATWLVAAEQGVIATTNLSASPAKPWRTDGSLPRPLVQYDVSNRTAPADIFITGTAPNQVWTATWAAGFTYAAKDLISTGFDLQVFDQVNTTTTAAMSTKHHVTLTQQDFVTKSLTFQGWPGWEGVKSLKIVLQRQ